MVLQFNPLPAMDMLVACLRDHWRGPDARDLWSFAATGSRPSSATNRRHITNTGLPERCAPCSGAMKTNTDAIAVAT
jgi:hypothetical protein